MATGGVREERLEAARGVAVMQGQDVAVRAQGGAGVGVAEPWLGLQQVTDLR